MFESFKIQRDRLLNIIGTTKAVIFFQLENTKVYKLVHVLLSLSLFIYIFDVYIKGVLGVGLGSGLSLYKDLIFLSALLCFVTSFFLIPNKFFTNKIDKYYLILILYGLFEVLWTIFKGGNYFGSFYKFRLYFFPYLAFFPLIYFFRNKPNLIKRLYSKIKIVAYISFTWYLVEFLCINTSLLSKTVIKNFIKPLDSSVDYYYKTFWGVERGFGVLGDEVLNGVFLTILFAAFFPVIKNKSSLEGKSYYFLGIAAIITSFGKTGWLLLLLTYLFYSLISKRYRVIKVMSVFMMISSIIFLLLSSEIGSTIFSAFKVLPLYFSSIYELIHASFLDWLFGFGYEVSSGEIELHGEISTANIAQLSIGSEVFFISILRQFGLVGFTILFILFFKVPFKIFLKDKDNSRKGAALGIMIAWLSSIHYNAILYTGISLIVCFLLAFLSITSNKNYVEQVSWLSHLKRQNVIN